MSYRIFSSSIFAGAGVCALLLAAAPAAAQDRDTGDTTYRDAPPEQVEVIAPRHHGERSAIGVPIVDVSMSRDVRYDDLDLSTYRGVRELRSRIRYAARDMCARLSIRYPVETSDSPPCYENAVADAMDQADAAIDKARSYRD